MKKEPGWITVTVTGVQVTGSSLTEDEQEVLRIATRAARFRVVPNDLVRWLEDDRAVPWPPASVTEQLQAEIDEIKSLIRTQWVYLFVSDGTDGRENGVMYAQVYTGQPHDFILTDDGILEVQYE